MTPSARLQAIIDLLTSIDTTPRPADALVSGYFRARRFIGSKDRAFISTTLYAILRHQARLEWWIKKESRIPTSPRLRLIAWLALTENKTAEQIDGMFTGKKFAPADATEDELGFARALAGHSIEHPSMPEDVKSECPEWAAEGLKKRFGKQFMREMLALTRPAPLDLRVNALKSTREKILEELEKEGVKGTACKLSPLGVRVEDRPSLRVLPMLKKGSAEIQDEGSQLVALLVDAKPGQRVVDFCAGAGGKTLAIAAQMKNKGRIVACDVLEGRLKRGSERFRRAGVHNIEVKPIKGESDPWVKKHKGDFDRVLVDAPCSGTGTWRRNPDSRWRRFGPDLVELINLQASILASASRLVKPGGRLIYATCSLLPEENEKQIEQFLAANDVFKLVPYGLVVKEKLPSDQKDFLSLTPAQHDTDGFFAAVMERQKSEIASED